MNTSVRTLRLAVITGLVLNAAAQAQIQTNVGTTTALSTNQPAAHGEPLPEAVLAQLRAQMPVPGAKIQDVAKIRRYRAVLNGGREAVSSYAGAGNLYLVQNLMLEAMQQLVELQTDDVRAEDALALAKDIVASDAPPAWKLNADVLLTDIAISKAVENPGKEQPPLATQLLRDFLGRYRQLPELCAQAAKQGYLIARSNKLEDMKSECVGLLQPYWTYDPDTRVFLRREIGERWWGGQPMAGDFRLLDGKILHLPQDLFGKYFLLHVWNPENPRCVDDLKELKEFRQQFKERPLEIVSVCASTSRPVLERVIQEQGLDWPQLFSGKGSEEPMIRWWGAKKIPSYALISWMGTMLADGSPLEQVASLVMKTWRGQARWDNVRTGVFMFFALVGQASSDQSSLTGTTNNLPISSVAHMPTNTWAAIVDKARDAAVAFPVDAKSRTLQELRSLCTAAEAAYPLTDEVGITRALRLASLEWLGLKGGDAAMEQEGLALAHMIVDAHPAPERRVLADYVLARQRIVRTLNADLNRRQTPEQVRAFLAPYMKTDAEWMALPLAVSLAYEVGDGTQGGDEFYRLISGQRGGSLYGQASNTNHPEIRVLMKYMLDVDFAHELHGQFRRLDGTPLNIPNDLTGRVAVIHFCTATAEPESPWAANLLPPGPFGIIKKDLGFIFPPDELVSTTDMVIVAVNLDRKREAAEAMAKKHPDWIVAQALPENPMIRRYDIYPFPATWVLTKRGTVFLSDESIDVQGVMNRDLSQAYFELNPVYQNPAQWQTVCNMTFHAKECFDTVMCLSTNSYRVFLSQFWIPEPSRPATMERKMEQLAREGVRGLGALVQEKGTALRAELGKLTPAPGGGWGPTNILGTVNEGIAAILDAKQMMDTGLGLREGMPWAAKPDIGALLQTAAQADCLRVSAAADGAEECKVLAKFFPEVPASTFALPLGTNAPSAPAGPPQRFFRLKRVE